MNYERDPAMRKDSAPPPPPGPRLKGSDWKGPRLGAHMSIAGGVDKAFLRGEEVGCDAMQIFTKNNNQWRGAPPPARGERGDKTKRQRGSLEPLPGARAPPP